MREASTVPVYPGLEKLKGCTGYEQLAGLRYASTKKAEIEALSCACMAIVYKYGRAATDRWGALTRSKKPTDASVRHAVAVINRRNDH